MDLVFAEESFALRGAFFEVHKQLVTEFLEFPCFPSISVFFR